MSKNIFNILPTNDSDEEKPTGVKKKPQNAVAQPMSRPNKREMRAQDQQLRERYGDQAEKERQVLRHDNVRNKGDYAPGEKRPYDRHSGTGRPAFAHNDFKKQGHGKGNVGKYENTGSRYVQKNNDGNEEPNKEDTKDGQENSETQNDQPSEGQKQNAPAEAEEIISAEDYLAKSGLSFGFLQKQGEVKNTETKKPDDPNLKVISSRKKDEPSYIKKAKNPDSLIQTGASNIVSQSDEQNDSTRNNNDNRRAEYNRGDRRGKYDDNNRKPRYDNASAGNQDYRQQRSIKPSQLNENDFPALN